MIISKFISKRILKVALPMVLVVCALVPVSCGSGGESPPAETTAADGAQKAPMVPADTARTAAFDGIDKADKLASGWREDAELYAVASATPQVDADGRAPSWLYTYVSSSAGAVASVSVTGGDAKLLPEQSLPDDQIKDISNHTLPPPGGLLDSPEMMEKAGKVRKVLESEPGKQTAAGLDSFSSGQTIWIVSTSRNGERVEERITAEETGGS